MLEDNIAHFKNDDSEHGQRLHSGFVVLKENLNKVTVLSESVKKEAPLYDFDSDTPGNGFRSFNNIVQQATVCVFDLCKQVCTTRDSILRFRKGHFVRWDRVDFPFVWGWLGLNSHLGLLLLSWLILKIQLQLYIVFDIY